MKAKQHEQQSKAAQTEHGAAFRPPLLTRIFLSRRTASVAVFFGALGMLGNALKQNGHLMQLSNTEVNLIALVCLISFIYGLTTLANFKWSGGRER
ncbi:hypothetical protein L4C34_15780 [Vibrio profundum]|uniref:hypothetical protein n=1 Tax=Vibrio profundum TaxID=2910247 RepID=UPI003D14E629